MKKVIFLCVGLFFIEAIYCSSAAKSSPYLGLETTVQGGLGKAMHSKNKYVSSNLGLETIAQGSLAKAMHSKNKYVSSKVSSSFQDKAKNKENVTLSNNREINSGNSADSNYDDVYAQYDDSIEMHDVISQKNGQLAVAKVETESSSYPEYENIHFQDDEEVHHVDMADQRVKLKSAESVKNKKESQLENSESQLAEEQAVYNKEKVVISLEKSIQLSRELKRMSQIAYPQGS